MEKVNIASLTIDVNEVLKKSAEYKRRIDEIKASQKKLDKSTKEGREEFVRREAELRNLTKSYRDNQRFASALQEVNADLDKALSSENKSTQELRDSRSQLNAISKNIIGNTEEEIELRERLNEAIDEQTEALRDQSSEFNASKDKIGEYENAIKDAFQELNIFNGGLSGFIQRSQKAGGVGNLVKNSFSAMKTGIIGATKASIAFIATPLGAALAVIAGLVALVKNAMNQGGESTNRLKDSFKAFSGIIKAVLKFLKPLGDFLIDGLAAGLEIAEKAMFKVIKAYASIVRALGFDKLADKIENFGGALEKAATNSRKLAEAERELAKEQRKSAKIQLDYQKRAEKLRQIRDDENKSISERIKANEDLGAVLREQLKEELKIAELALQVANMRIEAEGKTKEALDEQAEAMTLISDIQERITGQESEQLTNRVALQKEAAEKAKEIQQAAIERMKEELAFFTESQGKRAKTLQQALDEQRAISEKSIEILQKELDAKLISQTKFDTELLAIQNELLQKQAEITVDNAKRELDDYVALNQSKLDSDLFYSEETLQMEQDRLDALAEKRREFEKIRLEEGIISQTEYNDAINAINEENRIANEEAKAQRDEAQKEKEAEDLKNLLAIQDEQNQNDYEVLTQKLERERQAEIQAANATGADIALINEKFANRQKVIDAALRESKIQGFATVLSSFKSVAGEQSAVGKAAAVAETTINTYQSATAAYKAMVGIPVVGPTLATIAAGLAVAGGLANVAKIVSTPTTFAKGGILKGASHANGGIPFTIDGVGGFEAEGGETIINKKSSKMFGGLLSEINAAGGGVRFMRGGSLGGINSVSSAPSTLIDVDAIGRSVAQANRNLPNPIVSVEEINSVNSDVSVVESDATIG